MCKRREKVTKTCKVRRTDIWQILLFNVCGLILMGAITCSIIFDKILTCDTLCDSSIGIVCQVLATIAMCFASIIAISMSLQNDECFGIPVKKFNNIRVGFHFSINNILTVSIVLLLVNIVFYVVGMLIASVGAALVEIIFSLYLSIEEIPIVAKKEKALLGILKKRLWFEQTTDQDISKDLKDVLKYLISTEKNLSLTYNLLKSKDEKYNSYLLLKLLEIQRDLASEVKQIEDIQKRQNIIDAIIRNIKDVFSFDKEFDISEILKDNLIAYDYIIAQTLYKLHNEQIATDINCKDKVCICVAKWVVELRRNKICDKKTDFVAAILLSILSTSIAKDDFAFAAALRRELSIYNYELSQAGGCALIFALISMQLYYLYSNAPNVTDDHRANILDFLNVSGLSDNVNIISWKSLYNEFIKNYTIEFDDFWRWFKLNKHRWDVPLLGQQVYFVTLDYEFLLKWYLFNLLCSARATKYDYRKLQLKEMSMYDYALKNLLDSFFDASDYVIIPDQMSRIIEFFEIRNNSLKVFEAVEIREHRLFNFKNGLYTKDFEDKNQKAKVVDKNEVCDRFKSLVLKCLQDEWGYDSSLKISSEPRLMHIIIEKTSDAINFDEAVVGCFVDIILDEIRRQVSKSIIKKDGNFNEKIAKLLKNRIYAISDNSQYSIPIYLSDADVRKQFDNEVKNSEKFNSHILIGDYILLSNAFKFNFEFIEFRAINLTEEQISEQVETYKRADGQYIFEGAFLSRERIEEYVKNQFIIISIGLKLQVESWDKFLYEIDLYGEEDALNDDEDKDNKDDNDDDGDKDDSD